MRENVTAVMAGLGAVVFFLTFGALLAQLICVAMMYKMAPADPWGVVKPQWWWFDAGFLSTGAALFVAGYCLRREPEETDD
jgi:hypothetical protein